MNKAGRLTLVKSVLASIPIYPMQAFWILLGVCDVIDKTSRRFLWGKQNQDKGFQLINWYIITSPKSVGGLAI